MSKPAAVVVATDQTAPAVPVMVAVCLSLSAGSEGGAALSPPHYHCWPRGTPGGGGGDLWHCWLLTAVIFGMIIFSELEAVVAAALQVSLAASVAVMLASIARSVTVSLSFITGLLGSTTSPPTVVPPRTPLV